MSTATYWLGGHVPTPWEALAADRVARKEAARQQHAQAVAEWEAVRGRVVEDASSSVLLSVLDLHKPSRFEEHLPFAPDCDHCYDGGYDGERTAWPCETFEIIRDGLDAPH